MCALLTRSRFCSVMEAVGQDCGPADALGGHTSSVLMRFSLHRFGCAPIEVHVILEADVTRAGDDIWFAPPVD